MEHLSWLFYQELVKTQEYIAKELDRLGISYKKNKNDSGIIGEIKGGHSGKTILFRADIDALPIREDTGVAYCSKHDGYMHACGHDAHAYVLLGALRILQENQERTGVQIHVCGGPIATAAALQLEATIPNFVIHERHNANLTSAFVKGGKYYYGSQGRLLHRSRRAARHRSEMSEFYIANAKKVVIE